MNRSPSPKGLENVEIFFVSKIEITERKILLH